MPADETPSPRTEKLEGGRRYRAARLRAAVDEDPRAVAAAGSPARVVAVVERSEGEGKRSAEGKAKGRQRSAALLACGSWPQGSEGHGVSGWVVGPRKMKPRGPGSKLGLSFP